MAECGCIFISKYILIHLCLIFEVVGSVFLGYGVWFRKKPEVHKENVLLATYVWIPIVQGAMMIIMGVFGLYCVLKLKTTGLKVFSVLLAIFALADIVVGMVVHFSRREKGPNLSLNGDFSHNVSDLVMGFFLGSAALLIFTLICTTVFLKQSIGDYCKLFSCVLRGLRLTFTLLCSIQEDQ